MNGKLQSSDVKNETPYNIPLLINENVISSGISLISLAYLRRRALPGDLAAGQEETAYRQLMGCGVYRTRMWENSFKEWRTNNTAWQLYYILKANGYSLLSL